MDFNSKVKKGQVMARLDPTTYQAAVDSAQANLALTQANADSAAVNVGKMKAMLDLANLTVQRDEPLLKQGLINQNQMDTDQTATETARAGLPGRPGAGTRFQGADWRRAGPAPAGPVQPVEDRDPEPF